VVKCKKEKENERKSHARGAYRNSYWTVRCLEVIVLDECSNSDHILEYLWPWVRSNFSMIRMAQLQDAKNRFLGDRLEHTSSALSWLQYIKVGIAFEHNWSQARPWEYESILDIDVMETDWYCCTCKNVKFYSEQQNCCNVFTFRNSNQISP